MDQKIHIRINQLDRQQIIDLLESIGIACYDHESTKELREALRANSQVKSFEEGKPTEGGAGVTVVKF